MIPFISLFNNSQALLAIVNIFKPMIEQNNIIENRLRLSIEYFFFKDNINITNIKENETQNVFAHSCLRLYTPQL